MKGVERLPFHIKATARSCIPLHVSSFFGRPDDFLLCCSGTHESDLDLLWAHAKMSQVTSMAFYWSNQVTRWAGFKGRKIDLTPVGGGLLCSGRRELLAVISIDTHTHLPPYVTQCCLHANLSKEGLSILFFVPFLRWENWGLEI